MLKDLSFHTSCYYSSGYTPDKLCVNGTKWCSASQIWSGICAGVSWLCLLIPDNPYTDAADHFSTWYRTSETRMFVTKFFSSKFCFLLIANRWSWSCLFLLNTLCILIKRLNQAHKTFMFLYHHNEFEPDRLDLWLGRLLLKYKWIKCVALYTKGKLIKFLS